MISISYNYSTNDFEFLEENLKQAKIISGDIHVTYVNKFFDGSDENQELLNETFKICKQNCKLAEIQYNIDNVNRFSNKVDLYRYYHNYTRLINFRKSKHDYILFLDGDETIDGNLFKNWMKDFNIQKHDGYNIDCYWYFRSKKYQATTFEGNPVLIKKSSISEQDIMGHKERLSLLKTNYISNVKFNNQIPMIHHYSWAKGNDDIECKQKLLDKVKSWGHSSDKDWKKLIEEEFSRPFNGTDFIHGYKYKIL